MMWQHAQITHENLLIPLKLQNIIISIPLWIGLKQGYSFEHWLVMYLNIDFGPFILTKKVTDCNFKYIIFSFYSCRKIMKHTSKL